jgi:hypothetical protein
VNQVQKKKEEIEILKNVQVQEMKENLQELARTLEQLGKDVSEDIRANILEAEVKSEELKKNLKKVERNLSSTTPRLDQHDPKKNAIENKVGLSRGAKKRPAKNEAHFSGSFSDNTSLIVKQRKIVKRSKKSMGFSPERINAIYKMVDDKQDLNEVARFAKVSRAELQLILNLRGNRFTISN